MSQALRAELGQILTRHKAISDEVAGGEMPAEKRAEQARLYTRAMEIRDAIEGNSQLDAERNDMSGLQDWLRRPASTAPLPLGRQADSRQLARRGWELKAGTWYAMTSQGPVAMYPEAVLAGEPPKDDEVAANFFRATRRAMQPDYAAAYVKHFKAAVKFGDPALALMQMSGAEQAALSEGTDTAGGFLVPPDYQAEMLVRQAAYSVVRQAGATVQPTSRDVLRYPMVQAAAATEGGLSAGGDSIFAGGFVGSWAGETPAFTDKDAVFGLFNVSVKKIRCATKLGNDFVADSAVDVIAWLSKNGAQNMALVEDLGFLSGDGTALKPRGITAAGAANVNLSGSVANTISNSNAAVGSAPKIIQLWSKLPPQYDPRAFWVMSKGSEGATRQLVDAQNRYLWPDYSGSSFAAPNGAPTALAQRVLQGRPVLNSQFLVDGSSANAGAVAAIYGDFSAYVIAQRQAVSTVVLRERFADTDQVGIILFERVGGDTYNIDAFRYGIL